MHVWFWGLFLCGFQSIVLLCVKTITPQLGQPRVNRPCPGVLERSEFPNVYFTVNRENRQKSRSEIWNRDETVWMELSNSSSSSSSTFTYNEVGCVFYLACYMLLFLSCRTVAVEQSRIRIWIKSFTCVVCTLLDRVQIWPNLHTQYHILGAYFKQTPLEWFSDVWRGFKSYTP